MGNISVVGSSNTDMIVRMPRLPTPGETVLGGELIKARGGKGANQAVAAARAGGSVDFISCVGNDVFGRESVEAFRDEGINTDFCFQTEDQPSGVALIMVDEGGENCIAVAPGANASLHIGMLDLAKSALQRADVVLLQLEIPLASVEYAAHTAQHVFNQTVILNPAPAQAIPERLWESVSIVTPNRTEAEALSGVTIRERNDVKLAARALLAKGPEAVILTLGAEGAYWATREEAAWLPGSPENPVDTTGAGDVFNGALAVALSEKRPLKEAVRFANEAAAISVKRHGAQPSAPFRAEIESRLKAR